MKQAQFYVEKTKLMEEFDTIDARNADNAEMRVLIKAILLLAEVILTTPAGRE